MNQQKNEPIAVLISDIHFTVSTLELAAASLLRAQYKAKQLNVPLIICGDTLDSKAIIRAECMNKLMQMLSVQDKTPTYILVGNHDMCNEKGKEHSLNFLWDFCNIISTPTEVYLGNNIPALLIPYYSDVDRLRELLKTEDNPSLLIMHQGLNGADMGHYVQDKSALNKDDIRNYRVISGHYHRRQDIKCGRPRKGAVGLFSYVGNPYSLSFGEAEDGEKGFQILMENGTLEFVPTNFRHHRVYNRTVKELLIYSEKQSHEFNSNNDLIWLKLTGTHEELDKLSKHDIAKIIKRDNFRLDKIYTDVKQLEAKTDNLSDSEIFDGIIDSTEESSNQKQYLKQLWRELVK